MIAWEKDIGKALARGKAEQKCVMVEFYSHDCIGCKQMDQVTFLDQDVANFLTDRIVPVHLSAESSRHAADFRIVWTPTIVVLDLYGTEHQRTIGFLPPEELVASLLLGIGKAALINGQYNEAVLQFNTLLNGYPGAACAPEAVYMKGVARFRSSHAPSSLKECYQQLSTQYPNSEWFKRAQPYNLL